MNNTTAFQSAYHDLKALGLALEKASGEYRVIYSNGAAANEYLTDDLEDACGFSRSFTQGFSQSFTHPWVLLLDF